MFSPIKLRSHIRYLLLVALFGLAQTSNAATLDIVAGVLTYTAGGGINNALTVSVPTDYDFTDTAETITLGGGATGAGWVGSGTNTVTGTDASVSSIIVNLADGTNVLNVLSLNDPMTANGGAGDDTLNVSPTPGAADVVRHLPSALGAGQIFSDGAPMGTITFADMEHIVADLTAADNDELRLDGTIGMDLIIFNHTAIAGEGVFTGTMDSNNATGGGPFPLTETTFKGMDVLTNDSDVNFFNPGGSDTLEFNGTPGDDVIVIGDEGIDDVEIINTVGGVRFSWLEVFNVTTVNVNGDTGSDSFDVEPSGVAININGGNPTPPALPGDVLTVDPAGTTNPQISSTPSASGFSGSATFDDHMTISFQQLEGVNAVQITVEKEYTDGAQGPVTVNMLCSSGDLDAPSKPASPGAFAQFTLNNHFGATCTATESDVPGGYYLSATTCVDMDLQVGGGARCMLTNAPTRTTFEVQKVFSDDSEASVEVQIDCDNALIPDHIKILDADNNWHHTWVMIEFDSGDMNCTVSETRPAGYLEYYDADLLNQGDLLTWGEWYDDTDNPPEPDLGCRYENIVGGEEFYCEIYNELQAVEVDVTKQWFDDHREFKNPLWAKAHWECVNARAEQFDGEINHYVHPYTDTDEGYLEYSEYGYDASLKQTESFWVLPNWDTSVGNQTVCTIYEKIRDSSVISDNSDCEAVAVYPSDNVDFSCTITNTRIYEGVPTLSQYGLALLALLMLGVGLIGFRRFA